MRRLTIHQSASHAGGAEEPPDSGRAVVLSHNDVNPTNLVYDGEHVLLFDRETAAPNDPFYDLAAISVFLRMDEETCRVLLWPTTGCRFPRFLRASCTIGDWRR